MAVRDVATSREMCVVCYGETNEANELITCRQTSTVTVRATAKPQNSQGNKSILVGESQRGLSVKEKKKKERSWTKKKKKERKPHTKRSNETKRGGAEPR